MRRKGSRSQTYDDDGAYEDKICEEVSRLREPWRSDLKHATVCIQEVWIEQYTELGPRQHERCYDAP